MRSVHSPGGSQGPDLGWPRGLWGEGGTAQPGPAQGPGDSCVSNGALALTPTGWPDPGSVHSVLSQPAARCCVRPGLRETLKSHRFGKEVARHTGKREGGVTCWDGERGPAGPAGAGSPRQRPRLVFLSRAAGGAPDCAEGEQRRRLGSTGRRPRPGPVGQRSREGSPGSCSGSLPSRPAGPAPRPALLSAQ